jgi:hypothetical protein
LIAVLFAAALFVAALFVAAPLDRVPEEAIQCRVSKFFFGASAMRFDSFAAQVELIRNAPNRLSSTHHSKDR